MKAIWNGAIGFGLVNIPIKMYSATEESNVSLDMLDKSDLSNIKFKRVNENTGKEVAWADIVKAYNYNGKYVVLDDKDFESASPEKSKILTIDSFIEVTELPSVYFEAAYFLEPQKNGESAYNLLLEALKKTGKAGIGTFIMRTKETLGLVMPYEDVLIFQRIRYAQEIRDAGEIKAPKKAVKDAELKMAEAIIDQLTEKLDIEKYKDNYAEALMEVIHQKAKGGTVKAPTMKVVKSEADDLMSQLKASLSAAKKKAS